jgi:hypothetical protein
MPAITPNSPGAFQDWNDQEEHNRQHRNIEAVLETIQGGSEFGSSSNVASIKNWYRTAAPIAIISPAITGLGITTISVVHLFSIERQVGNPAQVGDAVILAPTTATPTNVGIGGVRVADTNTIEITYVMRTAATVTATFTTHVFFADLT